MKSMNRVVGGVIGLVFTVFAVGLLLPSHWHAEASIVINKPPAAVYPWVANFKRGWVRWSPFGLAHDPGLHMTYEGPDEGVGATQRWTAAKSGDGVMTIVTAEPLTGVRYMLTMVNGFNLVGDLAFTAEGNGTKVVWTDDGEFVSPFFRYAGLIMPSMLSRSLARGLTTLKEQVEKNPTLP